MEPVTLQMRFPVLGALRFSWFYWEKFTILKDLRAPGTHFGDPGLYFEDFFDLCDLDDICEGKSTSFLTSKCGHKSIFCNTIFLMFLERSVLEIFKDFRHLRLHFGSHFNDFLWEMGSRSVLKIFNDFLHLVAHFGSHFDNFLWEMGSRKNSWKCVTVINFRGLTPSQMEFFTSPSDGYAFRMIFSPVSAILGHLRLPFRRLLAWILRKKRVWKIMPKSIQKRASSEC